MTVKSAQGKTLTAPAVDSVNTFAAPNTVIPKPIAAKMEGSKLALTVGPKSVTVMLAGTPAACDELERALEVFTEVELHRTGRVALPRLG